MRVRDDVRAMCSFYKSIQDMAPAIHRLTCRPKGDKMAVTCPAAISFDQFFGKNDSAPKTSKNMSAQATVILITRTHTSTRAPLCLGIEGEGMERIHGRGRERR